MKKENIPQYIKSKFQSLNSHDRNFKSLFEISHNQDDRIFCEYIENYSIRDISYTDFAIYTRKMANYLKSNLSYKEHDYIGLLMENSLNWVALFWAILMIGGKPVLLNKKMPLTMLKEMGATLKLETVISDADVSKDFKNVLVFDNKNLPLEMILSLSPIEQENWEDEIVLTTTATTLNYKICIYKGADLYAQVLNAKGIIASNKMIKEHYNRRLKLLCFLPFYHIFGLVATYFWFSLFGRTFVFLKDYSSDTILKTVQRHKVTHIFGVPLLWNSIAKEIKKEINQMSEKEKKKSLKGLSFVYKLQNVFPHFARHKARKWLSKVQNKIFGDSVCFCITGGGPIPEETLYLINAIGYPLYNGYGSTEIGITSVELRMKPKYRLLGSIGLPFESVNYKIEDDILYVKGSSICSKIIYRDGKEEIVNKDNWYNTQDIAKKDKKGYYYLLGRQDDVCVKQNGEKINPDEIENKLLLTSVLRYCVTTIEGRLSLIVQLSRNNYALKAESIIKEVKGSATELNKEGYAIESIYYTFDNIASENAIKVSRRYLNMLIEKGAVKLKCFDQFSQMVESDKGQMNQEIINRIIKAFSEVLEKEESSIGVDSNFFFDLGGTSLEYMALLGKLEQEFEMSITFEENSYSTVNDFYNYIIRKGDQ